MHLACSASRELFNTLPLPPQVNVGGAPSTVGRPNVGQDRSRGGQIFLGSASSSEQVHRSTPHGNQGDRIPCSLRRGEGLQR